MPIYVITCIQIISDNNNWWQFVSYSKTWQTKRRTKRRINGKTDKCKHWIFDEKWRILFNFLSRKSTVEKLSSFCPKTRPLPLKRVIYAQNRIESTLNRIETSGQLILVFLIEIILKKFFFFLFESTSIRLKKIANRSPLIYCNWLACTKMTCIIFGWLLIILKFDFWKYRWRWRTSSTFLAMFLILVNLKHTREFS